MPAATMAGPLWVSGRKGVAAALAVWLCLGHGAAYPQLISVLKYRLTARSHPKLSESKRLNGCRGLQCLTGAFSHFQ